MKQIALILLALLAFAPAYAANFYKWVDKNGVVHYSDQPHPGAKPVDLPGLSSYNSRPAPPSQTNQGPPASPGSAFKKFTITSPNPDETIHANDGRVPVVVSLDPRLRRGQTLIYTLDGKQVGASSSTSITLTNVVRGTHTLSASVRNGEGKTIGHAPSVTFYVRHHSTLNKTNATHQFPKGPARNNSAFQFPHGANPPR